MDGGDLQVVTSTMTLTEVLVHPYRDGNQSLAEQYLHIPSHARNLRTIALSPAIASEAAQIRANYHLKTPDAIQLATAKESGATAFLTNDTALTGILGLRLVVLDQLKRELDKR